MFLTYQYQKQKQQQTNKLQRKLLKFQTFLKVNSMILQTNGLSVATLIRYCLN